MMGILRVDSSGTEHSGKFLDSDYSTLSIGLTSLAVENVRVKPLESVLKHALAMIGRAPYKTD